MRHATDPDHVIAVTTILSRERRIAAAMRVGVIWGLGHTATVMLVGAAIIIFKIAIPARIGLAMEFAVALVLILLGVNAASRMLARATSRFSEPEAVPATLSVHSHAHSHGAFTHTHPHAHPGYLHEPMIVHDADHLIHAAKHDPDQMRRPLLKSFGVGLVHGLAGSAAIALLVLSAIPEPMWATVYLVVFCIGVIIGMGLITSAIAAPFMFASRKIAWLHQGFVTGSGLLSFAFGLFLAYHIGFVDGLFRSVPIWIPH